MIEVKIIRPKTETSKTIKTINKGLIADTGSMKGPEIEFVDGSILMFASNDLYYDIITDTRYYRDPEKENGNYQFDLDQFISDFLVDQDDVNGCVYRNNNITGLDLYSIEKKIQAYRLEF